MPSLLPWLWMNRCNVTSIFHLITLCLCHRLIYKKKHIYMFMIHMYMFRYTRLYVYIQCIYIYIYTYIWCALGGQPNPWAHGLRRWWTQQLGSRCHRVSVLKSDVATIARHGLTPTQCIGNCFFRNCMCINKVMCENYVYYIWINMQLYKYDEYND